MPLIERALGDLTVKEIIALPRLKEFENQREILLKEAQGKAFLSSEVFLIIHNSGNGCRTGYIFLNENPGISDDGTRFKSLAKLYHGCETHKANSSYWGSWYVPDGFCEMSKDFKFI